MTLCNPVEIKKARKALKFAVKTIEPSASMVMDFIFSLIQTTCLKIESIAEMLRIHVITYY